jgi:hypothetical protein
MDPVVADLLKQFLSCCTGLFGAIVGAAASLVATTLIIRKERQQWEREQKAERQKWGRDELRQIYSKCFYYVSHSNLQSNLRERPEGMSLEEYKRLEIDSKRIDDEINRARHEWFNLLLLYYPDRKLEAYNKFVNKIQSEEKVSYDDILELALEDPRLMEDTHLLTGQ